MRRVFIDVDDDNFSAAFLARLGELVLASLAAAYAYALARRGEIRDAMQALPSRDCNLMLIGCALLLGCFFTAENAPYRNIYFLFYALKAAPDAEIAKQVENRIWAIWLAS